MNGIICTRCGKEHAGPGVLCEKCAEYVRTRARKYYARAKEKGLCVKCGREAAPAGGSVCRNCRVKMARHARDVMLERSMNERCIRCGASISRLIEKWRNTGGAHPVYCDKCRVLHAVRRRQSEHNKKTGSM